MTAGSMVRSLLKQLPKVLSGDRREFPVPFQALITLFGGFFQGGDLIGRNAIFSLRVIRGLNGDFTQRNDIGAADYTDIITARRGGQPTAQIPFGVGNREGLHIDFISPRYGPVNACFALGNYPAYGKKLQQCFGDRKNGEPPRADARGGPKK